MLNETFAIAALLQIVAEPGVSSDTLLVQVADGFAVKTQNVAQHAPKSRRQQIAALGKQAVERIAVVFKPRVRIVHGEAHFSGVGAHPQLVHQFDEIGIGPIVENDESRVDRIGLPVDVNSDGMGVAADPVAGFKHRDVVGLVQ